MNRRGFLERLGAAVAAITAARKLPAQEAEPVDPFDMVVEPLPVQHDPYTDTFSGGRAVHYVGERCDMPRADYVYPSTQAGFQAAVSAARPGDVVVLEPMKAFKGVGLPMCQAALITSRPYYVFKDNVIEYP